MPATLKDDRDARNDQSGDKDPDGVHRFVPPFLSRLWIVRRGEHRPLPGSPYGVSAVSYSAILILRQIPTAVRVDSS